MNSLYVRVRATRKIFSLRTVMIHRGSVDVHVVKARRAEHGPGVHQHARLHEHLRPQDQRRKRIDGAPNAKEGGVRDAVQLDRQVRVHALVDPSYQPRDD